MQSVLEQAENGAKCDQCVSRNERKGAEDSCGSCIVVCFRDNSTEKKTGSRAGGDGKTKNVELLSGSHQDGLDQDRSQCALNGKIVIDSSLRLCGHGKRRGDI